MTTDQHANRTAPTGAGHMRNLEAVVGQSVKALRTERGWSQDKLGKRLAEYGAPMNQPMVYKLEHGARPLRVNELQALAFAFDVELEVLLTGGNRNTGMLSTPQVLNSIADSLERLASAAETNAAREVARAAMLSSWPT